MGGGGRPLDCSKLLLSAADSRFLNIFLEIRETNSFNQTQAHASVNKTNVSWGRFKKKHANQGVRG